MIRQFLSCLFLSTVAALSAQTYFYIDEIQVQPAQPTSGDLISLQLIGGLAGTGVYIVSADAQVVGPNVTVNIVAADNGGLTVIVPHTENLFLGQLPAGTYTVTINGVNVGDFAPPEQHSFVVSGGDVYPCDSLTIASVEWQAFGDSLLYVHVFNNSSELFDYPNFILYDAQGDTLAVETTNFFGIPVENWHPLTIVDGATVPEGPFAGTLELYTGFGLQLACTFNGTWDLCPPEPCIPMIPQLMNTGGGITVGDFAWSIQNDQGAIVGSGIFTLTNDSQFDTASVCLPPGAYGMIVTPLGDPTGGQPVFSIYHPSSQAGPSQAVTWIPPVPMPFTWFGPCSDGAQAVDEPSAIAVRTALSGGELHVWRADGAALGELRLLDARGGLVATDPGRSSDARLPLNERGRGLYLLQSAAGTVRFVVVD